MGEEEEKLNTEEIKEVPERPGISEEAEKESTGDREAQLVGFMDRVKELDLSVRMKAVALNKAIDGGIDPRVTLSMIDGARTEEDLTKKLDLLHKEIKDWARAGQASGGGYLNKKEAQQYKPKLEKMDLAKMSRAELDRIPTRMLDKIMRGGE